MKTILHDVSRHPVRFTAFASLSLLLAVGCGGKQSVASKSAAAYQEALKKGVPIGEGSHGGHVASEKGGMAGMDHSKMKQGEGMAGTSMGDPITAAIVADKSAAPTAGKPAAILSPDPLDAPAATAVEDAQRSKQMNEAMAAGEGMTMSHGSYVQKDAGRPQATPTGKR